MPYSFDVVGWEDYDGNRHEGKPSDISATWGELVHAYDPATGADEFFWAFVPYTLDDWDDWYEYIEALLEMYGLV